MMTLDELRTALGNRYNSPEWTETRIEMLRNCGWRPEDLHIPEGTRLIMAPACEHCHKREQIHVNTRCLFGPTTWTPKAHIVWDMIT